MGAQALQSRRDLLWCVLRKGSPVERSGNQWRPAEVTVDTPPYGRMLASSEIGGLVDHLRGNVLEQPINRDLPFSRDLIDTTKGLKEVVRQDAVAELGALPSFLVGLGRCQDDAAFARKAL